MGPATRHSLAARPSTCEDSNMSSRAEFESRLLEGPVTPDLRMNGPLYRNIAVEGRWKGWNLGREIPTDFQPLADFYKVETMDALIRAQSHQIDKLLSRLPTVGSGKFPPTPRIA